MLTCAPTVVVSDRQHIRQLVASRREGYGLPRAFYHDGTLYEHEMERIWRRGWVFAGHTCQIPRPGDFMTFTIDTDSLIVMRDDEGCVRAFHNVCTHRGTLLRCHGMQDDIDKGQLGLHAVHVETCEGLIFVSLATTLSPFEPARRLMAPFARPQGFERARVARIVDYEIRANWKVVWENNRECYHCSVNHPQYVKSSFDIYEDGHGSARIHQRLAAALARGEATWQREGKAISHKQGGLAPPPGPLSRTREYNLDAFLRWYLHQLT